MFTVAITYLRAWSKIRYTSKWDLVTGLDFAVVSWVGESKWEHTLFLQVGLVNTSKRLDNDSTATQVTERNVSIESNTINFQVSSLTNHLKGFVFI